MRVNIEPTPYFIPLKSDNPTGFALGILHGFNPERLIPFVADKTPHRQPRIVYQGGQFQTVDNDRSSVVVFSQMFKHLLPFRLKKAVFQSLTQNWTKLSRQNRQLHPDDAKGQQRPVRTVPGRGQQRESNGDAGKIMIPGPRWRV